MKNPRNLILASAAVVAVILSAVTYILSRQGFFDASSATISEQGNQLVINFNIVAKDKSKATEFSNNLGTDTSWEQGLKITLDNSTLNLIGSDLPVNLRLGFEPKELTFNSFGVGSLSSGLIGKNYQFSTGSGTLKLNGSTDNDFSLQMSNPQELLKESTKSGTLYLSKQLDGLMELSGKVDTINLSVHSGNISGDVKLR